MIASPDMISTALKMLSSLAVILGALLGLFYLARRMLNRDAVVGGEKLVKVLANTYMGAKKSIALVEIPGAVLVLGVTGESINLLARIDDREIVEHVKSPKGERSLPSFADQLQKWSSRLRAEKGER